MADETITPQVSERYARALATEEQMSGEAVAGVAVAWGLGGSCC